MVNQRVALWVAAWVLVIGVGVIGVSQTVSRGAWFPLVYIGQALSPYLFAAMVPVALVALARRDLPLGIAAALVSLPLLALSGPLIAPTRLPPPEPGAPRLRVLSTNVLYRNDEVDRAAGLLVGSDVDVLVVSELTDEIDEALDDAGIAITFPHRAGTPDTWNRGLAVWSKYPIISSEILPVVGRTTIEAVIDVNGTAMRVIGAHPPQPISPEGRHDWRPALHQITAAATEPGAAPTLLVGDLNASYWHPPYREILDTGLIDVHLAMGKVFSHSWPADMLLVPAFVRIDHALVGPGLTATDIHDLDVPGSDHVAFVVTVTLAAQD